MSEKKIVLAVDDVSENLSLLRSMLEDFFDVRLAKSAKMALSLLENTKVDLILLDIEMPGMSGLEFLNTFREKNPDGKHTPVIIVTSHASTDFVKDAINAGAKDYLVKPIKTEALHKKIDSLIGMPAIKARSSNPLENKLDMLIAALGSGDSARSEALVQEIAKIVAQSKSGSSRLYLEKIETLIRSYEFEKAIKETRDFLDFIV
jgi:putative two-component system response regulator